MQYCLRWKALLVNLCISHVLHISTANYCLVYAWLVSPSYPSHHTLTALLGRHPLLSSPNRIKKNRVIKPHSLSVASSSSTDQIVVEEPILRTLYDAPTQINDNTTSADHGNTTNTTTDSEYITEITEGTLSTESSHELYFQVHHRFLNNNTREVPSSSTNSNSSSTYKKESKGLTALFLHGGPGAGCYPNHVRFFSPQLYETVILLDQRGCGRSTPLGEVANNTLELLVNDIERLRMHLLGESRPFDVILGGSWGCTCAMAYAHTYPRHVRAMVLRGVCLFRPQEIDWLFGDPQEQKNDKSIVRSTSNLRALLGGGYNDASSMQSSFRRGSEPSVLQIQKPATITQTTLEEEQTSTVYQNTASKTFPKGWKEFCKGSNIAKVQTALQDETQKSGRSILHRYYNLIIGKDPIIRFNAVKSWLQWEMGIYSSGFNNENVNKKDSNAVWVWNPTTELWVREDARVMNNESFTSVEANLSNVEVETVQLLRRFSSVTTLDEEAKLEPTKIEPMPVYPVIASTSQQSIVATSSKTKNSNSTFDPTTYIPAQSMLTCYYSANDNYCIGPYRSFLSLSNEPSWYSSKLPPQTTLQQGTISTSTSIDSFSLPPTIAIQGGNDAICPPDTALDLHEVWKELELRICVESGHSMYDSVICGEIVKALDRFGHSLSVE